MKPKTEPPKIPVADFLATLGAAEREHYQAARKMMRSLALTDARLDALARAHVLSLRPLVAEPPAPPRSEADVMIECIAAVVREQTRFVSCCAIMRKLGTCRCAACVAEDARQRWLRERPPSTSWVRGR